MNYTPALLAVLTVTQPPVGTDIPSSHWAHAAIKDLAAKGLVFGYPDGRFLGERSLTRYELAALTKRLLDYLVQNQPKIVDRVVVEKPGEKERIWSRFVS
jgi:S-layer homology domain